MLIPYGSALKKMNKIALLFFFRTEGQLQEVRHIMKAKLGKVLYSNIRYCFII